MTQLEFQWGDWIEPAESRLFDDCQPMRVRWNCGTVTRDGLTKANFLGRNWEDGAIDAFAVPAGHAYYLAVSRGFTYWPGGESVPDDWDGGECLARDGSCLALPPVSWRHPWSGDLSLAIGKTLSDADVIGYHKKPVPAGSGALPPIWDLDGPPPPGEKAADWAYERIRQLTLTGSTIDAFALYIEAHELPPVDPDVAAVRRILATWNLNRDESVANQLLLGNFDEDGSFIAALDVYRGIKAGGQ